MKIPYTFTFTTTFGFIFFILFPILYILCIPLCSAEIKSIFDERHITLAQNSFLLAIGSTFFCLIIGIPLAFCINGFSKNKILFLSISVIPLLIPPYIHAIVWNKFGLFIDKYFYTLNIHGLKGSILILTLSYFPLIVLVTFCGINSIDKNQIEVGLLIYDRRFIIRTIFLPLILPYIFSGAIFVFVFSIVDFGVPDMLRLNVYPIEIFIQFSAFYDERSAIILSFPLIIITIFLILYQKFYMRKRRFFQINRELSVFYETHYHILQKISAFIFYFIVIFFSTILPIIILILNAGSLSNYIKVWHTSKNQIYYTLALSFTGSTVVLILGFSLAYIVERTKNCILYFFEFVAVIPLAIPATTIGICLIKIWNRPIIDIVYSNTLIIIFGYLVKFIPFSFLIISSEMKNLSDHMEETAFLVKEKWIDVIRNITLPLLKPSLCVSFFIVFIFIFGELGTTLLLMPPGRETVAIKIYNLMHYGAYELVYSLCLIQLIIISSLSGLFLISYYKFIKY